MMTPMVRRACAASSSSFAATASVIEHARSTPPVAEAWLSRSAQSRLSSLKIFSGSIAAGISSTVAPLMAEPSQHLVSFRRAPSARLVIRKPELTRLEILEDRLRYPPTRLHHVLAGVQGRVAEQRIHEQRLVGRRRPPPEACPVL